MNLRCFVRCVDPGAEKVRDKVRANSAAPISTRLLLVSQAKDLEANCLAIKPENPAMGSPVDRSPHTAPFRE
jgi:hypothetical protein